MLWSCGGPMMASWVATGSCAAKATASVGAPIARGAAGSSHTPGWSAGISATPIASSSDGFSGPIDEPCEVAIVVVRPADQCLVCERDHVRELSMMPRLRSKTASS